MERSRRHLLRKSAVGLGALSFAGCLHGEEEVTYVGPAGSPSGVHNWPMHRYDAGNSSYNPDTYGPKRKPEIEWEFDLEDRLTSFVVADGMVFVASGRPDDTFYALNAVNGGVVWSFDDFGLMTGFSDPPAYDDGYIYIVQNALYKFDSGEGQKIWRDRIGGGAHQEPKYADGKVYVYGGGYIYCFSLDGSVEWRSEVDSARPIAVNEGKVVVSSPETYGDSDEYLAVLDAEDGSEVWSIEFRTTRPVARDGVVYFSGDRTYALDIHDGTELWRNENSGNVRVLTEGEAYLRDTVLDIDTGEELWRLDELGEIHRQWRGAGADGVLYMDNGEEMWAVDTESREMLWEFDLGIGVSLTEQPVVADGRIYVGHDTRSKMHCLRDIT